MFCFCFFLFFCSFIFLQTSDIFYYQKRRRSFDGRSVFGQTNLRWRDHVQFSIVGCTNSRYALHSVAIRLEFTEIRWHHDMRYTVLILKIKFGSNALGSVIWTVIVRKVHVEINRLSEWLLRIKNNKVIIRLQLKVFTFFSLSYVTYQFEKQTPKNGCSRQIPIKKIHKN